MRKTINSKQAPKPLGPYSQAIFIKDILFISGQVAINELTDELVIDDIEKETTQVMKNLEHILAEAKLTFDNVVKCSIFLKNMDDFEKVNNIYGSCFSSSPPARETVEVSKLPKNVNVEISCIAIKS